MAGRVGVDKLEDSAFVEEPTRQEPVGSNPPPVARRLLRATAVFPFQIFPDELVIDEFKVTIVSRVFFFDSGRTRSILFKDIADVALEKGLLFAAMEFGERGFATEKESINFLWRDEAERARRVIEGMIVLNERKVDTTKLGLSELLDEAERLGRERGI